MAEERTQTNLELRIFVGFVNHVVLHANKFYTLSNNVEDTATENMFS